MTTTPKPDPGCPNDDCECQGDGGCDGVCPVDLAEGSVEVNNSYLSTPHSGNFHLTWYNRWNNDDAPANFYGHVGTNWTIDAFAYVSQSTGGDLVFVWSPGRRGKSVWFSQSGTTYTPKFGARQTLTRDGNTWRIAEPNGTVWEFDVISELVSKMIAPGGQVTEYLQSDGLITEKRRTVGNEVEARVFTYTNGNVSAVTLYRGVPTTPHQTAVRKVVFSYYDSKITDKGNLGDLKTVTTQCPHGTGWRDVSTRYYRYYTSNTLTSFVGGLKYVVDPTAYANLADPENANDVQIAAVAEKFYQYDSTSRRVTQVKIHGGTQTTTIEYTTSNNTDDYNHWQLKSVATMPDGSTKTVFANHASRDLLVDNVQGADRWIHYTHFNADGHVDQRAQPSSIDMSGAPYNQNSADLNVQLNANKGLIRLTTYYASSDTAPDYPKEQQVKQGAGGAPINLSKFEYEAHTVGSGSTVSTVYPVTKRIAYQSDTGAGDPVETTYTNTFHAGTTQLKKVVENLPNVGSGQNGGAWLTGNTRIQEFDIQGRLEKSTDARGVVTEYEYDNDTGVMTQMKQDPTGLNLVINYTPDDMGRTIETLGPAHNVNGQTVRTVGWSVYLDDEHEVRTAQGYLIGATSYTLVNPVSIQRMDNSGRVVDEIQATRGSGVESAGALTVADTFAQTSWARWRHHHYGDDGRLEYTRVYHNIPTLGDGASGTNYDQTDFGYDAMGRQNKVKSPGGTISRTVYDTRGLVLSSWVGTNDTGATDSDPTGGGATGNNMKPVTQNTYDTNAYGSGDNSLDGLLTKVTSPVDDTTANDREVEYHYDWRDRQITRITTDGVNTFHTNDTLDNLGRTTVTVQERTGTPDVLIAKSEAFYDDRGQVYQTKRYAVSDAGVAGNALTDNTWYDADGNVLKSQPAGSEAFSKMVYDAIGRATDSYTAYYDGTGTDNPTNLTDNVVFEETNTTYDTVSNVTFQTTKSRWHDATGNGALNGPSGSQPKSRDSYAANWFDGIGRQTATADYGTNDNSGAPSRPNTAPASSNTILVSQTDYNLAGEVEDQTDPAGQVSLSEYDNLGRITKITQNSTGTEKEITETAYTADGQVKTLTAQNATTGDQTTTYAYGVTLSGSEVASNDLLHTVTYPDSGVVTYEYNRQGQRTKMTDQNGSVHEYVYDDLGQQVEDKVVVGIGVLRIVNTYDDRTRLEHVTSYSTTSGTSGVVNDIQYAYNDFNQVNVEYQQHGSMVNTSTSPKVQYGYANGSQNTTRRESVTYPDGKVVNYHYGAGADRKLSRVKKIQISATDIVEYEYLGLNQVVIQKYVEPSSDVSYTLATGSGSNPYAGMDRFGRIIDLLWEQP